ncbi:MAG TPA: LamG domain-containing protein [Chthoniobacteraceae bacterium]|nr:LamG domain-containing protein [Chthoniobacteraceae bacterium]
MNRGRFFIPGLLLVLASLSAGFARETHDTPSPVPIFSRAQLKYGLERTDYYNRWIDRPLFADPSLADLPNPPPSHLSRPAFIRTQKIVVESGLSGLAFFPERSDVLKLTAENGIAGFQLLTDLHPNVTIEKMIAAAGQALANPASFRMDGKVVMTSYLPQNKPLEFWAEALQKVRETHGDHFIFLPGIINYGGKSTNAWIPLFDEGKITPDDVAAIKEDLRKWARVTDGLYTTNRPKTKNRTFHTAFYRDFIIRYMKEVLAEPEFAGKKYLGLSALIGHENNTRFGYTLSCEGTATLRESLEASLEARPALIAMPEWDEQNENTSLRPTVYNGRTAMRLLRHYTAGERGQLQEPLPGDDTRIPNFILSYRKRLVLGEELHLELLHIPEHGLDRKLTAQIELRDEKGAVVHTSAPLEVTPGKLWVHTEMIPSERLAGHRYLSPVLTVSDPAGQRTFSDGLQVIDLRATWNWDYKWAMQPLRELLLPTRCDFEVTPPASAERGGNGWLEKILQRFRTPEETQKSSHLPLYTVSARFEADEPLAYVELLDNDDVVYSHAITDPQPREDRQTAVFRLDWQSLEYLNSARPLKGSITLKGAQGSWVPADRMKVEGQRIILDGLVSSIWVQRALLSLPQSQLDAASLEIDLPGIWKGELSLRQVSENEIYGLPGPVGFNLVISRFLRQDRMPYHLNAKAVSFSVPVAADLPRSRLQLQAISVSGKVYRSRPVMVGTSSAPRKVMVFSEHAGQPVSIQVEGTTVPDIIYQFTPERNGAILRASAGRPFWGILGGFSSQATGRGGGESRDGTPFLRPEDYPGKITNGKSARDAANRADAPSDTTPSAPQWVEISPGVHALAFNGKSTFITLPQGAIPRRAGYEITMELMPDHVNGSQLLIANRSYTHGSLSLFLDQGRLKATFLNESADLATLDSGLKIEPGQWSFLRVRCDQKSLVFQVNDQASQPIPLTGPGCYDTPTVVGGYGKEWFAGKIKSLRIRHGSPESTRRHLY